MGRAEFRRQLTVVLAWILAGAGGDFGCQQVHDRAVLVGRPHGAVVPQEAGPGALLAAEAARAFEQARHEPFEAHADIVQPAPELVALASNQTAAHELLTLGGQLGQAWLASQPD